MKHDYFYRKAIANRNPNVTTGLAEPNDKVLEERIEWDSIMVMARQLVRGYSKRGS